MEFLQLAQKRCSVRRYTNQPVETEKLAQILEVSRIAPTGANKQPFQILVVNTPDGLAKVHEAANIYQAPLALIICGDQSKAWVRPVDSRNIVETDCAIVTDHMMLTAADLGLDSVWICMFKPDVLKTAFAIPEHLEPLNILAIGYGAEDCTANASHLQRKPLEELICYHQF